MNHRAQILTRRPRLGTGFAESEGRWVARRLVPLLTRLRFLPDAAVELDLSVKDRHGADPRVTLVCRIAGRSRLVSTSAAHRLGTAVSEVRDDVIRQISTADAARTRRKPRTTGPSARR